MDSYSVRCSLEEYVFILAVFSSFWTLFLGGRRSHPGTVSCNLCCAPLILYFTAASLLLNSLL